MSIKSVENTDLFVGTPEEPRQVLRVRLEGPAAEIRVAGEGIRGAATGEGLVEVPLENAGLHAPGACVAVTVTACDARVEHELEIAEPGWTMYLVSHFHYDPVWWNTQASYTSPWDLVEDDGMTRKPFEYNAFKLIDLHMDLALRDPVYKFVLAEVDYLKPYFDQHPERRAQLRELMDRGQVELMGGTYNEPSTNLTGAEATIRNIVHGIGYQRDILGGDPRTAWQLDVFGHDPQFPGFLDAAGLTGSAWARGPFHQWGPIQKNFGEAKDDARVMQFPSEFEWISPSGRGVLTHYMPHHYSAGWWMDESADLETATQAVYDLYHKLKPVASTRNLLLPVGTDYTPPNRWVLEIHRTWAEKYVWPRFACALPRDFLDAVRAELAERGVRPSPQSRDMNPIYTGKDVSFIDTKQAQRACEVAILDAEKLATLAALQGLGRYPAAAIDKAWRQLAYGAHHDAITGSESDQVYLDLLTGWREAYDLATGVRDASLAALLSRVDLSGERQAVVVFNTLSFDRSGLVRLELPEEFGSSIQLMDESGVSVPCGVESGMLHFYAHDVPALGWRTWHVVHRAAEEPIPLWRTGDGLSIENARYRVTADPDRGGALASVHDMRCERELISSGDVGNELRVYEEYPQHPDFGEGPWHLVPKGLRARSSDAPAQVRREVGPLGERLIVTGAVDGTVFEQTITLWRELDRVECRTRLLDFTGSDRLLRVRFPADLPGALPVSEVADAVIGRGFAWPESDVAAAPWTLDNPANTWFGLGSTARVELRDAAGAEVGRRAVGIAEIVVPTLEDAADARDLVAGLARVGVTATTSAADWARYGWLEVDSNLPDFRILLGGQANPAVRELLENAGAEYAATLEEHGRVWIPALAPLSKAWVPNADLRDLRALPALVVAAEELSVLVADVADAQIEAVCPDAAAVHPEDLLRDQATVALLTKGLPGFAVDPDGALYLSLLRSCTGWPSAGWIDPPQRALPDGRGFQLQHWTHEFEYALVAGDGDWRALTLPAQGQEFNHPLYALPAEPHEGDLPATWSWLRITPQRHVLLGALKPTGDPLAHGSVKLQDPAGGVTLRLVEATGRGTDASLRGALQLERLRRTDLLEEQAGGAGSAESTRSTGSTQQAIRLGGSEVVTLTAIPSEPVPSTSPTGLSSAQVLGQEAEIAQPVYARYWLHNRGPAPLGNLPVTVSANPAVVRLDAGSGREPQAFDLSVVVTSHLVDASVDGVLKIVLPAGWKASLDDKSYRLGPSGYERYSVRVTPAADAEQGQGEGQGQGQGQGVHFVALRTEYAGQQVEDVVTVAIGEDVRLDDDLEVTAHLADSGCVEVVLRNRTRGEIRGELQLIAPHDLWDAIPQPTRAFFVAAGESTRVPYELCVPPDALPGTYWAVAKAMYFGRTRYTEALPLVFTR